MSLGSRVAGLVYGLVEAGFDDLRVLLRREDSGVLVESAGVTVEHQPGYGWEVASESSPVVQTCADVDEAVALAAEIHGEVLL